MEPSRGEYIYLPLADAIKSVGVKVSLFCVVSEIGQPSLSQGTDFMVQLKVIDPSYPALGISVKFFADIETQLPHVLSKNDIISLHHVTMKIQEGECYCVYDKRFSSFALFKGENHTSCIPYQICTKYQGSNHDNEYLTRTREWLAECPFYEVFTRHPWKLDSIQSYFVFDLICKVLHISVTSDECVMFVWDGTDTPTTELQWSRKNCLDNGEKSPVPLYPEKTPPPREVFCTFPCIGSILRVFSSKYLTVIPNLQANNNGTWVKLSKITCEVWSGLWKGKFQPFSKIQILSDIDCSVLDRLREYNDRTKRLQNIFNPAHSCLTGTVYPNVAYSTLMDSLTNEQVLHQIKTIVQVVDIYPKRIKDFRSPSIGNFRVRLTLEDRTARIHAYLMGEEAEGFFGNRSNKDIKENIKLMLGIVPFLDENIFLPRVTPPVEFCLKSIFLDERDPLGSRRYLVVGTRLVD